MNVAELIEKLKVLPPDAEVIVTTSNFEQGHKDINAKYVHLYLTGSKRMQEFRDAFDYESYSSEIYSIIGGDLPVVKIS